MQRENQDTNAVMLFNNSNYFIIRTRTYNCLSLVALKFINAHTHTLPHYALEIAPAECTGCRSKKNAPSRELERPRTRPNSAPQRTLYLVTLYLTDVRRVL